MDPQELEAQEAQRHETFGEKSILELLRGYERMGPKVVPGELFQKQASQGGASRAGIDRGPLRLQGGGFPGEKPNLAESLLRGS